MTVEEARPLFEEARRLQRNRAIIAGTCWRCKPRDERLKPLADRALLFCHACNCWYFRGHNLTEILELHPECEEPS